MPSEYIPLSQQCCFKLFDSLVDSIVVFDSEGKRVYSNKVFDNHSDSFKQTVVAEAKLHASPEATTFWKDEKLIKQVDLDDGFAYIISPARMETSIADSTLKMLSNALEHSDNVFDAAVEAIYESLGWRWVSVTRFLSKDRVEVLSSWDTNKRTDNYEFSVLGTPCEQVVNTNKFIQFDDVISAFPTYQPLHDIGAKVYAGLVYRGADNQPLGHIMVMHDHKDVDFVLAEEVISVATLALSSYLQLHKTNNKLREVEAKANIDGLTGIGNRHAYQEAMKQVSKDYLIQGKGEMTIAVLDLDNLKPLNDKFGHAAGDKFIKLMASELSQIGRQSDCAFRIGGDEFAVIFSEYSEEFVEQLKQRISEITQRVSEQLSYNVGASVGFSSLSEVNGDVVRWASLADERMYEAKKLKAVESYTGE
ncbi:GGDEF domain-containing protein [Alteromonas sp. KUL49]|uniref:GGDEF domain-containing protein n=1 Tax=Alteromonas sp. KUL49 TaxID=2480798 RepID=UPI00102F1049|nr:GGDEF domain-containing protein [Alteromonas sp. KUL49]TAP35499.1 GGDEF domain-containing protein [Alteromonas sp. KUL49]GEA13377.1 hypothetical protein KUL49_37520 [Alteromonas sp. KUL49]